MSARARVASIMARIAIVALVVLAGAAAVVFAATRDDDSDGPPPERAGAGWGSLAPSPLQRTEVGAARIGDRIYVVGGFISSGGTTGRMVAYDISDDEWSEVAELPIGVNHPGVTAHRGRLYVLGGNRRRAGGEQQTRRLYEYRPGRDRWRRLADAPTSRGALALAAIGNRLYAVGGYGPTDETLRTLEVYDLARERWSRRAPMPTGRNHVAGAVLGGELIVTGGRPGPDHGGLDTVEAYDPERNRWRTLAPLGTARSGHAAAVAAGRLVVFGGEELDAGGSTIAPVEAYDPAIDSWRPLPDMVTPRHGVGGAAAGSRVFALEGGPQPGLTFSRALEYLDLP